MCIAALPHVSFCPQQFAFLFEGVPQTFAKNCSSEKTLVAHRWCWARKSDTILQSHSAMLQKFATKREHHARICTGVSSNKHFARLKTLKDIERQWFQLPLKVQFLGFCLRPPVVWPTAWSILKLSKEMVQRVADAASDVLEIADDVVDVDDVEVTQDSAKTEDGPKSSPTPLVQNELWHAEVLLVAWQFVRTAQGMGRSL